MNAVVKVLALGQRGMMAGTGWFCKQAYDMTKRHFLITNAHVVANGSGGVFVRAPVRHMEDLPVRVHSMSTDLDIAVLEMSGAALETLQGHLEEAHGSRDVPMLSLCDSDLRDEIGSAEVVARGYPGGSEYLLTTKGVLSGRRHIFAKPYLQTQASINPGNSGGPSTIAGLGVIGINTMKQSQTEGESLLIPSTTVLAHLPELLRERAGAHKTLMVFGIDGEGNLEELARAWDENNLGGYEKIKNEFAKVSFKHWYETHSEKVGFHKLLAEVYTHLKSGSYAELDKMRRLGWEAHMCPKCPVRKCNTHVPQMHHVPRLGLQFSKTCDVAKEFYKTPHSGVIVSDVVEDTLMHRAGLQVMDYLTHITTDKTYAVDRYGEIDQLPLLDYIIDRPGQEVTLHIVRAGQELELPFVYEASVRPHIRWMSPMEAQMDKVVSVGGMTLKQLRLNEVEGIPVQSLQRFHDPHTHHEFRLVVCSVHPASPSFHTYAVQTGDVVAALNGKEVRSWEDFQLQETNALTLESGNVVLFK